MLTYIMMARQFLYATSNPGKLFEVRKYLEQFRIEIVSPRDIGLDLEVAEEGKTLEENAAAKVRAYLSAGFEGIVMADDTGIEIDALGGAPGIRVRRWRDGKTRMSDQEIIEYCLSQMKNLPPKKRGAQFRTVVALGVKRENRDRDREIELFDGILRGEILQKPMSLCIGGFPFESLFYIPEWKLVLGEVHQLPAKKKMGYLSHRERAVKKAMKSIGQYLKTPPWSSTVSSAHR